MKKYGELRALYVGNHPLFTEGASVIHMLKMCQAMANLGITVECVLKNFFCSNLVFITRVDFPVRSDRVSRFCRQKRKTFGTDCGFD